MTKITNLILAFILFLAFTSPPQMQADSVTYVNNGDEYVPVSLVSGGEQMLVGYGSADNWIVWKVEVNSLVSQHAPRADSLRQIDTGDMYSGPRPEYFGIPARVFTTVASDGDWDFFPVKVTYEKYSLDNQPDRPDWADYLGTDTVYNESWSFELDGKEAALVNASNIVWHDSDQKAVAVPVQQPDYTPIRYNISVLFVQGNEPFLLYYNLHLAPLTLPLSEEKGVYESFLPPTDSAWYESYYSVIQRDAQGNLVECPVFTCGEFGYQDRTMVLLCDIDGDGIPELLTMQTTIYAPVVVYKFTRGTPREVFRVNTGA